jgi:hypothetical protein
MFTLELKKKKKKKKLSRSRGDYENNQKKLEDYNNHWQK